MGTDKDRDGGARGPTVRPRDFERLPNHEQVARRSSRMVTAPTLSLVREAKIRDLMTCDRPAKRWEASGVLVKDGSFYVVFDGRAEVGRFSDDLRPDQANGLVGLAHAAIGYEGIAYNTDKQRFYLLVEARKRARGCYQAVLAEYNDEHKYLKERPLDFPFEGGNKGFEAVAHARRNGRTTCWRCARITSASAAPRAEALNLDSMLVAESASSPTW
jgi:hypothetical protein